VLFLFFYYNNFKNLFEKQVLIKNRNNYKGKKDSKSSTQLCQIHIKRDELHLYKVNHFLLLMAVEEEPKSIFDSFKLSD
jgi:hypothetical protein